MMPKRAFLVCGPESCGNRIFVRLLIAAGCFGDGAHYQRLDHMEPSAELIAWGRSFPWKQQWPDLLQMVTKLRALNYEVIALVPTRDWFATAISQKKTGHVWDLQRAYVNQQGAYKRIFAGLDRAGIPFVVVHYDSLVKRPGAYIRQLMTYLNLPVPAMVEDIFDATEKRYREMEHA